MYSEFIFQPKKPLVVENNNSDIAREPFVEKYIKNWRPGHNKGDGYYILSQKPEYIQLVEYLTTSPQGAENGRKEF